MPLSFWDFSSLTRTSAVRAQSLNYWTAREFLHIEAYLDGTDLSTFTGQKHGPTVNICMVNNYQQLCIRLLFYPTQLKWFIITLVIWISKSFASCMLMIHIFARYIIENCDMKMED